MELDIYTTILDHGLEPESVMDAFEKGAGPQDIYDAFTERIDVEYILVKEKN
jgi:hypothetical protein